MAQTDNLTWRPFEDADFEPLADVLARTWLAEFPDEPGAAASRVELARYLALSTWSLVVARGDEVLGAVLLAEDAGGRVGTRDWAALEASLRAEAEKDPALAEAVRVEMSGVEEEAELEAAYAATGAVGAGTAVKLLIVSPDAKGLGLGGRLFSAAIERVRQTGAPGYHLLTDDSCDVGFYEHKGLTRAMERRSSAYWPGVDPATDDFRVYVYEQAL